MDIQHELHQRTMEPCDISTHHRKPRSTDLGGLFEIKTWPTGEINVIACNVLIVGTVFFLIGTVLFFPSMPPSTKPQISYWAEFCFLIGSAFFLISACIDYLRLRRSKSKYTQFEVVRHSSHDLDLDSYTAFKDNIPVHETM